MKEVELTRGYKAQVDDEDYERVMQFKWHAHPGNNTFYAMRYVPDTGENQLMHRFILGLTSSDARVDHSPDPSGLNNQRNNLRIATCQDNNYNRRLNSDNTSGFKGVTWNKASQRWRATIKVNRRKLHLGYFEDSKEAAKAYDIAAIQHHGMFAKTNEMLGLLNAENNA